MTGLAFWRWRIAWAWRQFTGHHRKIREARAAAALRGIKRSKA